MEGPKGVDGARKKGKGGEKKEGPEKARGGEWENRILNPQYDVVSEQINR